MAEKTATYAIRFDSNVKETARGDAQSLEDLKATVGRAQDSIKTLSAATRGLKGSSDEVKSAREALKAQLEAEKTAITGATLALLKMGTSYDQVTAKEKAAAAAASKAQAEQASAAAKLRAEQEKTKDKIEKSVAAAGGPVAELRERFKKLGEAMSTSEGRSALFAKGLAAVASAATAAIATVVALGAALGAGFVALGAWIVQTANAQRSLALLREGWSGSATNAQHLGNQIDALAKKIPTPKAELNELAGSLVRALSGTRVSGQGIVDTFQAVATAASAMGDQAGSAIEEIIKRSARFGRVNINPFELQGTGIKFKDVAWQLAKDLKVGVGQAQQALLQGRVKVDDAAKAIREVLEKRFGEVNAKKLLSLESIGTRFKESLAGLTSGVKFDGLLRSLSGVVKLFDKSTVTGKALGTIITAIGNFFGKGFEKQLPKIKTVFLYTELAVLKLLIGFKKVDQALQRAFGKDYKSQIAAWGLDNAGKQMAGLADILERTFGYVVRVIDAMSDLSGRAQAVGKSVSGAFEGFESVGRNIIDGLINGIKAGFDRVKSAVSTVADVIKKAFTFKLEIGSPSKVFERYGRNTTEGYEKGVQRGTPGAQKAAAAAAPTPGKGAASAAAAAAGRTGAAARGGGSKEVHVHLHIHGGGADVAKQITAPNVLRDITRAIEEALTMQGLPMQTEPSS